MFRSCKVDVPASIGIETISYFHKESPLYQKAFYKKIISPINIKSAIKVIIKKLISDIPPINLCRANAQASTSIIRKTIPNIV